MSGFARKIQRQRAKAEGTLVYKKKVARKLGVSVAEFNRRMKRREENLKKLNGGNDNGKE